MFLYTITMLSMTAVPMLTLAFQFLVVLLTFMVQRGG